jgi:parallel beta-helix repeat protein
MKRRAAIALVLTAAAVSACFAWRLFFKAGDMKEGGALMIENPSGDVVLPSGVFRVHDSIRLSSAISRISGSNTTIVLEKENAPLFLIEGRKAKGSPRLTITGISFEGPPTSHAVEIIDSEGIQIEGCSASGLGLLHAKKSGSIRVANNIARGTGGDNSEKSGIVLERTSDAVVSGNDISGYRHGITLWGGDANYNKKKHNPDVWGVSDILIQGNTVRNVSMGGIWASRGERLRVLSNQVENCGDVGVDLEGSREAVVADNIIRNCRFGGLTVFFSAENLLFSGNVVSSNNAQWPVFRLFNVSQKAERLKGIVVEGNTFSGTGVVTTADDANGCAENIVFQNNRLSNVLLKFTANNTTGPQIRDNTFTYDLPLAEAVPAISLRTFGSGAVVLNNTLIMKDHSPSQAPLIRVVAANANVVVISGNFLPDSRASVLVTGRARVILSGNVCADGKTPALLQSAD